MNVLLQIITSKVKLMGWESSEEMPAILRQSDVEVVLGNAEVKILLKKKIIFYVFISRLFCVVGRDWKILKTSTDQA